MAMSLVVENVNGRHNLGVPAREESVRLDSAGPEGLE
jgi:hypothetical protein